MKNKNAFQIIGVSRTIFILFFLIWQIKSPAAPAAIYNTLNYLTYYTHVYYFWMSEDLSKFVIADSSKAITFYSNNQGNLTIFNEIQTAYTYQNPVGASLDFTKIFVNSMNQGLIRVYSQSNFQISVLQQLDPFTGNPSNFVDVSADGSRINAYYSSNVVSYLFNGVQYNVNSNTTLPSYVNCTGISPDGLYLIYTQAYSISGSSNFRIYKNNGGLTQVYISNFSAPASPGEAYYSNIQVSSPVAGVYDLIFLLSISSLSSTIYFQFDSNTNTGTIIQTIISNAAFGSFGYSPCAFNKITLNGNYFAFLDKAVSPTLVLYQKIANQYTQIYTTSLSFRSGATFFYLAQAGNFFVTRNANTGQLQFFFTCNVLYCSMCSWIDTCSICNAGLLLVNNTCQCPAGKVFISGVCTSCSILNCIMCSASNVCSKCGNGFTLSGNACVCGSGYNISLITGNCVSCNVAGCYNCFTDNVCGSYSLTTTPTTPTTPSNQAVSATGPQTSQQVKSTLIALGSLVGGLLGVLGVVIYKLVKISSIANSLNSLNNLNQQTNPKIQEPTNEKLPNNLQSHQTLESQQINRMNQKSFNQSKNELENTLQNQELNENDFSHKVDNDSKFIIQEQEQPGTKLVQVKLKTKQIQDQIRRNTQRVKNSFREQKQNMAKKFKDLPLDYGL